MALNEMQQQAVDCTEGPLLILAGAGSGKTTVLVNRVQHIIEDGLALPWQVLAITFTNKAAGEIRERLVNAIGEEASSIWAFTFHSCCARILRRFGERLGYSNHFTIYDTDDQKRVMKHCQKSLGLTDKIIHHKSILNEISSAKDSLIDPIEYKKVSMNDFRKAKIADCYELYQKELLKSDAMDFDDIIFNTVKLLQENDDVRELYQKQFRYVMVDEYQDTSHAQYVLVSLLADGYKNICVVGDDDQSIYRFRGATIENILSFEQQYKNARVIRLEQNYRSTQNILDGANAVISNNKNRKGKSLWTAAGAGNKIILNTVNSEADESTFIADEILKNVNEGRKMSDHAVLYRMNAQSRNLEITLTKSGIPHKIIGGNRFFDRKEIKDIISYFAVINNPADNVRLQRIINVPKRGIGDTMFANVLEISTGLGISAFEVCERSDEFQKTLRSAQKLQAFTAMIKHFQKLLEENMPLSDLLQEIISETKYFDYLAEDPETEEDRKNNINELSSMFIKYQEEEEDFELSDFLEDVALVSDAGTPLISDPGVKLVDEARLAGYNVVPIVGASAILALLASIPRQNEDFKFIGFLPRRKSQIENLVNANKTENLVFYESPNRLIETLSTISKMETQRKIAIGRELTKKFEEIKVDTVENLLEYYSSHVLKGEIACMLYALEENSGKDNELCSKIFTLKGLKLSDKDIVSVVNSLYGAPKNEIKEILLQNKNS